MPWAIAPVWCSRVLWRQLPCSCRRRTDHRQPARGLCCGETARLVAAHRDNRALSPWSDSSRAQQLCPPDMQSIVPRRETGDLRLPLAEGVDMVRPIDNRAMASLLEGEVAGCARYSRARFRRVQTVIGSVVASAPAVPPRSPARSDGGPAPAPGARHRRAATSAGRSARRRYRSARAAPDPGCAERRPDRPCPCAAGGVESLRGRRRPLTRLS
jgi:hypothetical protein